MLEDWANTLPPSAAELDNSGASQAELELAAQGPDCTGGGGGGPKMLAGSSCGTAAAAEPRPLERAEEV